MPDKRLAYPNPTSLAATSDEASKTGVSSLFEIMGTKFVLLAVRDIFCLWPAQWATGGDEDRADVVRFRLLAPTATGGLSIEIPGLY